MILLAIADRARKLLSNSKTKPGERFGRLVISGHPFGVRNSCGKREVHAVCTCDCGTVIEANVAHLRYGHTTSCGCFKVDLAIERSTTHGLNSHPLHTVFAAMKGRCYRETDQSYEGYGGRGIRICQEWLDDFRNFYDWAIDQGWRQGLQVDRRDNNGDYSPDNCRIVCPKTNNRNRSNNRLLTAFGETKAMAAWLDDSRCRATIGALQTRLKRNWSHEAAISTPVHPRKGGRMGISFTVFGNARTAGSKRAFYKAGMKRAVVVEDNHAKTRDWKEAVASAARQVFSGDLLRGPLSLTLTFYRVRPRGHFSKATGAMNKEGHDTPYPISKPDVLKMTRAIEDALTGVVWADDAQIVSEQLRKEWGEPARVEVCIEYLDQHVRQAEAV